MKKKCLQILCLMLALLLPVTALAEPQSWLRPWINRMDTKSSQAVVTIQIDSEAVLSLAEMALDMQRKSFEEMAATAAEMYGEDEEYADFLENYVTASNRYINTQRAAWRTYVPAVAALANSTEIAVQAGENCSCLDFRINGTSWFTLNLIYRPEEGDALLTSDLFPACALSLKQSGGVLSAFSPSGYGEAYENWAGAYQELLRRLPEYEGFDFLGQLYDAYIQAMNLLEADGLAVWEGDALVYEYTTTVSSMKSFSLDKTLNGLFQNRVMVDVDERLYRLYDLISRLVESPSADTSDTFLGNDEASDPLPVLGEDATENDYYDALNQYYDLMYKNRTVTTSISGRLAMAENGITHEINAKTSVHYHPIEDETGTIEKLLTRFEYLSDSFSDDESTSLYTWSSTPTEFEYHGVSEWDTEVILRVDTSAENEILFTYTIDETYYDEGAERTLALLLTRTDEGQQWTMTLPVTSYLSLDGVQDTEDAGTARFVLSYDNDMCFMDMPLSALGLDLMRVHADSIYSDVPASAPDVSGLTIISNDDEEAMQALYKNLLAVGVPKLNRLILTGLPEGATALMTPLLSFTSGMAQLGR